LSIIIIARRSDKNILRLFKYYETHMIDPITNKNEYIFFQSCVVPSDL